MVVCGCCKTCTSQLPYEVGPLFGVDPAGIERWNFSVPANQHGGDGYLWDLAMIPLEQTQR